MNANANTKDNCFRCLRSVPNNGQSGAVRLTFMPTPLESLPKVLECCQEASEGRPCAPEPFRKLRKDFQGLGRNCRTPRRVFSRAPRRPPQSLAPWRLRACQLNGVQDQLRRLTLIDALDVTDVNKQNTKYAIRQQTLRFSPVV